jgi:RNA polymerase sigma-70 factor (ECF subfamily)
MLRSQPLDAARRFEAAGEETDQHLLQTFLAGNPDAFDRLFLKYQDYVYNICLGILGNADDARDSTQETFLRVYRKAADFRGHAAFSTWIYRIAVNVCVGQIRKRPRAAVASLEEEHVREAADPGPAPWDGLSRREEEERVRKIVAELPPDYRLVLVLRYFQGLSYEEMVGVLGWTLPTVKVKLYRARRAFAARYND